MLENLAVAEGFAMASGALMAGIAGLLWRHHAMRPAWGLRWLAVAMALAAITDLFATTLISGAWRNGLAGPTTPIAGLLALVIGFGSLAALLVGTQHFLQQAPQRPWQLFLTVWLGGQFAVLASVKAWGLQLTGDLLAAGIFLYGAALAWKASRREPGVGHLLLALSFVAHPLTMVTLAALDVDMRVARYLAAVPYAMVGLVLLSVSLVRIRSELAAELQARTEAEASNRATEVALQRSHGVQEALLQLAPIPMAFTPVVDGQVPHSYWNQAWYRCFGHDPGSQEGMGGGDFDFYVEQEARDTYMRRVLTQGHEGPFEIRLRHASGAEMLCRMQGSVVESDEGPFVVSTFIDITEQRRNETALYKAQQMAEVIARAQLQFIVQKDRRQSFDGLLNDILRLADSAYGFIGEVLRDANDRPYLKTFAITNIAWDESTRNFYQTHAPKGMEFNNLKTLFGQVMVSGQPMIANEPSQHPHRGGLPKGHPALNAFLGVPVFHGDTMVAMYGLSNRPGGYDEGVLDYLRPLTATIGQLVVAHRMQTKQQETEVRLNSISNNLPGSMVYQIDCGEDGQTRRFTYLSAGVEHLHGLSRDEVMKDAGLMYAQVHPEDLPRLAAKEQECMLAMQDFNIEYRGKGPQGEERWYYLRSTPSRNANQHIVWDGIEVDITERKRAEAELALSRMQLMANLDKTPTVAVQWFDREGRVLYWNPASEALYGVPAAEVLGRTPLGALYANEAELQALLDVIQEIDVSGQAYGPYEVEITRRDGRKVWVLATTFPIPFKEGQTAFVCMDVDITERKEAERRLAELNQTLESRVEERTRELHRAQQELIQSEKLAALGGLVAGVAHELNTPIGNAVTVASTLADAEASMRPKLASGLTRAALNGFLDTVHEASTMLNRNLMRAADLVTSFKQVAVDQNNHQRRPFELQELLSEVQIVMTPSLRKSHVALDLHLRDAIKMDSFPGALTQVLMILISNAIAHAFEGRDGGRVSMSASLSHSKGQERVSLVVADDGVGIPMESLGRIFEPFFTTKLGKGGSGLGLHIAYNLVTGTLGGRISAESHPGQGARFVLDLPLVAASTGASAPNPMKP